MTYVDYEVYTLADLIEVCQAIHNETGNVDPSTIRIESAQFNRIWMGLRESRLSDGSTVFDVEV